MRGAGRDVFVQPDDVPCVDNAATRGTRSGELSWIRVIF